MLIEENLPPVIPLKLEKIDLPEDYTMGASCYVYQDSVLLVVKEGDPKPLTHMLTIINMNTGAKIGEYFTRGNGPQEVMYLISRYSSNCLDLTCIMTHKFISFNIDSALLLGDKYLPYIIQAKWDGIHDYRKFDDTSFLVSSMLYFDGSEEYNSDPSVPEFYKLSYTGNLYPTPEITDFDKVKYFPANVTGGDLLVNKEKQRVVCCYHYRPRIKIFDWNMNLIKQINGPEPDNGEYEVVYHNMLFFNERVGYNHYYFGSNCDDKYIFSVNNRTHNLRFDKPGDSFSVTEKQTSEIFQLDWDCNVIARYSAKGYNIYHFNYSSASNTLYLWLIDENDERALYKAKLN